MYCINEYSNYVNSHIAYSKVMLCTGDIIHTIRKKQNHPPWSEDLECHESVFSSESELTVAHMDYRSHCYFNDVSSDDIDLYPQKVKAYRLQSTHKAYFYWVKI